MGRKVVRYFPFFLFALTGMLSCQGNGSVTSADSVDAAITVPQEMQPDSLVLPEHDYSQTLDLFRKYAFSSYLTESFEAAKDFYDAEGSVYTDVFSDEEGRYILTYSVLAENDEITIDFNHFYNSDGIYESSRHILMDAPVEDKPFLEDTLTGLVAELISASKSEFKCFRKSWGASGKFFEIQESYGAHQFVIQRAPDNDSYPWLEVRESTYKDVSDGDVINCD